MTCRGIGFVYSREVNDVTDNRHGSRPCPECGVTPAALEARAERRRVRSGVPARSGAFSTYVARSEGQQEALEAAQTWASTTNGPPWLFLHGTAGTGKTHLARAAALACCQSVPVLYRVAGDLLAALRAAIARERRDEGGPGVEDMVSEYREIPVFVLDDLGAHQQSDFAADAIYRILNYRYEEYMPTIVTTNAHPASLDARLVDRLMDRQRCRQVEMVWDSFRVTADSMGRV